jgi:hypothetical protein
MWKMLRQVKFYKNADLRCIKIAKCMGPKDTNTNYG